MVVCLSQVYSVQRRCVHLGTALPDSGETKDMAGMIPDQTWSSRPY